MPTLAYLGGRYQTRTAASTTRDSNQSTLLAKRDEFLWAQLEAANVRLETENTRLNVEVAAWRSQLEALKPITTAALNKAEASTQEQAP